MKAATNNLSSAALQPRDLISRMKDYHPPLGDRSGIRLDFNENTVGCSPRALDRLRRLRKMEGKTQIFQTPSLDGTNPIASTNEVPKLEQESSDTAHAAPSHPDQIDLPRRIKQNF